MIVRHSRLRGAPERGLIVGIVILVLLTVGTITVAAQAPLPPPPPTISSIGPTVVDPGQPIRIRGRDFVEVRSVSMAGLSLRYKVKSRNLIIARAPANAARGTVVVSTRGGVATSPRFVVVKPRLRISPLRVPAGEIITASGDGFMPGEPIDLYLGRASVSATGADSQGRLGATTITIPPLALPGADFLRAQGRFSGVPVDVPLEIGVDWPGRGLGPDGNRYNQYERILGVTAMPALKLDWAADAVGPSRSSPTVVGRSVYVGVDTGALLRVPVDCATDGATCHVKALGVAGRGISSTPAVADALVYVGSGDGRLSAFDRDCPLDDRPCPPVWSATTGGPISSSPVVADGRVFVGSEDGSVYAFGAACETLECAPLWVGQTGGPVRSSPAVHDGVVYVGSDDGYLAAFDADCADDGRGCDPLWRGWTGGAVRSSPTVSNGIVYIGSADSKVHGFPVGCAVGNRVCQAIWRGQADAPIESSPVVAEGYVVVGTMAGSVMAFPLACSDAVNGCAPLWTADTGGAVRSSAAIGGAASGGPAVFIGSDDGFVYGYSLRCRNSGSPARCQPVWASGTRGAISGSPTLVNGVLYAASEDGTIRRWSLPSG